MQRFGVGSVGGQRRGGLSRVRVPPRGVVFLFLARASRSCRWKLNGAPLVPACTCISRCRCSCPSCLQSGRPVARAHSLAWIVASTETLRLTGVISLKDSRRSGSMPSLSLSRLRSADTSSSLAQPPHREYPLARYNSRFGSCTPGVATRTLYAVR